LICHLSVCVIMVMLWVMIRTGMRRCMCLRALDCWSIRARRCSGLALGYSGTNHGLAMAGVGAIDRGRLALVSMRFLRGLISTHSVCMSAMLTTRVHISDTELCSSGRL